ncbi:MAG: aminoacyl-tRNA hydrolase [bacterium]|nr:aminoacyl-tRNA hydrolase [bacterium]MDZ4295848.1 aminoacyl-tRNA hydrolase [Patescibacteria group bacterium]MDZ4295865.1 aminoacyl-tRNA hydrolase [Patescibacteria group bacterium]
MTKLIIGLGNPGDEYAHTRHNTGFMALDAIAAPLKRSWSLDEHCLAEIIEETARGKDKFILAKPQTMMNRSGKAAGALARKFKAKPEAVVVVHDDIDLPLGKSKLSFGKRSAGHKGVESVIGALKTKDFWRLRIGIHPAGAKKKVDAMKIILAKFTPAEERVLKKVVKEALANESNKILSMTSPAD